MSDRVSVLVAHYAKEAEPFLEYCMKALSKQTLKPHEIILVSSNNIPSCNLYGQPDQHYHSPTRMHFPEAIEKAYSMSDPTSEYIFILNDDAILSKHTLEILVRTMQGFPKEIILNPRSNCSPCTGFYFALNGSVVDGSFVELPVQMRGDDLQHTLDSFIEHSLSYPYAMIPVPFAALFATLIKRSTYEKIGKINPRFRTGSDDAELALRASKYGIGCWTALHAACAHASGISADVGLTDEDRNFNMQLMRDLS